MVSSSRASFSGKELCFCWTSLSFPKSRTNPNEAKIKRGKERERKEYRKGDREKFFRSPRPLYPRSSPFPNPVLASPTRLSISGEFVSFTSLVLLSFPGPLNPLFPPGSPIGKATLLRVQRVVFPSLPPDPLLFHHSPLPSSVVRETSRRLPRLYNFGFSFFFYCSWSRARVLRTFLFAYSSCFSRLLSACSRLYPPRFYFLFLLLYFSSFSFHGALFLFPRFYPTSHPHKHGLRQTLPGLLIGRSRVYSGTVILCSTWAPPHWTRAPRCG